MNTKLSVSLLILVIIPLFSAYREPQNGRSVAVSPTPVIGEKYIIDKKESVVAWSGSMVFAEKGGHTGYVSISKGELTVDKGQLVGGSVELDMNTIVDKVHGGDNGLVNHLKDPDFFDVRKFPTSMFAITKVEPANDGNIKVTGDLTIKGITHPVTFPASVEVKGGVVNADGKSLSIARCGMFVTVRVSSFPAWPMKPSRIRFISR